MQALNEWSQCDISLSLKPFDDDAQYETIRCGTILALGGRNLEDNGRERGKVAALLTYHLRQRPGKTRYIRDVYSKNA